MDEFYKGIKIKKLVRKEQLLSTSDSSEIKFMRQESNRIKTLIEGKISSLKNILDEHENSESFMLFDSDIKSICLDANNLFSYRDLPTFNLRLKTIK